MTKLLFVIRRPSHRYERLRQTSILRESPKLFTNHKRLFLLYDYMKRTLGLHRSSCVCVEKWMENMRNESELQAISVLTSLN